MPVIQECKSSTLKTLFLSSKPANSRVVWSTGWEYSWRRYLKTLSYQTNLFCHQNTSRARAQGSGPGLEPRPLVTEFSALQVRPPRLPDWAISDCLSKSKWITFSDNIKVLLTDVPKGLSGSTTLHTNTLITFSLLSCSGLGGPPIRPSPSPRSNDTWNMGINTYCKA